MRVGANLQEDADTVGSSYHEREEGKTALQERVAAPPRRARPAHVAARPSCSCSQRNDAPYLRARDCDAHLTFYLSLRS